MNKKQAIAATVIIVLTLLADQVLKIWIKTNLQLHESIKITDWFYLYFTENNGMAFGMELIDKLYLTLFRIVAAGFIGYYLTKIIKEGKCSMLFVCSIALIFVGAVGNIVDSVFYGVVFNHSVDQLATLFPAAGGYETWFHGKVVDMFYFPLIETVLPQWVPIWGGEEFVFFRPIFNIADSAISVGVFFLLLFHRHSIFEHQTEPDVADVK